MSSSKKKQLRKEQYMTERQAAAAQEAKKLKRYTLTFWVVILVVACIFVGAVVANPLKNVIYSNTKAMQVGEHTLTSIDVNYYYIDAVNSYVNQNSQYLQLIMDTSKPLNEQIINKETGATWADNFLETAKQTIKSTYALYTEALKNGYKLDEADEKKIDTTLATAELYATYFGYNNLNAYLRAMYGNGASESSYRKYLEVSAIANAFMTDHQDSLEYTAEQLDAFQATSPYRYNAYTYASYYLSVAEYRTGGTKDDKGNTTYSDEEKAAAVAAAKAAADKLAATSYADLEAFDAAIQALTEKTTATATRNEDVLYDNLSNLFQNWLTGRVEGEGEEVTFETRTEGEMTVIEYASGTGDSKTVNGYYVLRFGSVSDNKFAMKNVRHVLIAFEGGTTDSTTGKTIYTDAEKNKAKLNAEKLMNEWVANGDLSEESFGDLAKEHTKDSNGEQGGLYENVYPGQMVEPFESWLYDAERKVGDYGLVETEYGWHIMYFVGDSETSFRDYIITSVIRSEDMEKWNDGLVEKTTLDVLTTKHLELDMVLSH
jgi:hypothetical protein